MPRPLFSLEPDLDRLIRLRRVDELDEAIARGFDINEVGADGDTLLLRSCADGQESLDWATALLDRGADVNFCNAMRHSPLMLAVIYEAPRHVALFAERGADLELKNSNEQTALNLAFDFVDENEEHQFDIVHSLIKHGAHFNERTGPYQRNLLHEIANCNSSHLLELLDDQEVDLDTQDQFDSPPLHVALLGKGPYLVAKWMLERGAKTEWVTPDGKRVNALDIASPEFKGVVHSHIQSRSLNQNTPPALHTKSRRL